MYEILALAPQTHVPRILSEEVMVPTFSQSQEFQLFQTHFVRSRCTALVVGDDEVRKGLPDL